MSKTESEKIKVLIADDHPVVREGLSAMLMREKDIAVVTEYVVETGETVQKVLDHFSRCDRPYLFVNAAVVMTVLVSFGLAIVVQQLMDKIKTTFQHVQ